VEGTVYLPVKMSLEEEIPVQNLQKGTYHSFDVSADRVFAFLFRRVYRKSIHNCVILRGGTNSRREVPLPRDLHRFDLRLVRWWNDGEIFLLQPHSVRENQVNAFVLNLKGKITRTMRLGNGVSDVAVSPRGLFWVVYKEEAVNTEGAMGEKLCRGMTINNNTLYYYRDYDRLNDRFYPDAIFDVGGASVDQDGRVWLAGYGSGPPIIAVLDAEGKLVERRPLQGEVGEIHRIAPDRWGGCFLTNYRHKLFYLEKGFRTPQSIVVEDTHRGRFTHPGQLRITPDNCLIVGDKRRNLIGVFRLKPRLSATQPF
jgi:hypothetical protein